VVLYGSLDLRQLEVTGVGTFPMDKAAAIREGESVAWYC
jgi:hypothetical protein